MRFAASASVELRRNPITGIAGCCARTISGRASAALVTPIINSRRRMAHAPAETSAFKRQYVRSNQEIGAGGMAGIVAIDPAKRIRLPFQERMSSFDLRDFGAGD